MAMSVFRQWKRLYEIVKVVGYEIIEVVFWGLVFKFQKYWFFIIIQKFVFQAFEFFLEYGYGVIDDYYFRYGINYIVFFFVKCFIKRGGVLQIAVQEFVYFGYNDGLIFFLLFLEDFKVFFVFGIVEFEQTVVIQLGVGNVRIYYVGFRQIVNQNRSVAR